MKKDFVQLLKVITLGIILSAGISFATGVWEDATSAPPGDNAETPVNVGLDVQIKDGGFSSLGAGYFRTTLNVGGFDVGDKNSNLLVSGKTGINFDDHLVDNPAVYGVVSQTLDVNGTTRIHSLASGANPGVGYPAQVCADSAGTLVLCASPLSVSANASTVFAGTIEPGDECPGDHQNYTFSANITGGATPFTYQWQRSVDGGAYANVGTSATYAMTLTVGDSTAPEPGEPHTYTVRVTVTDGTGLSATSVPNTYTQLMVSPTADYDHDGHLCPV